MDKVEELLKVMDFEKMNNHTLYHLFESSDLGKDGKKELFKHLTDVQKNKIVWGCRNRMGRWVISHSVGEFKYIGFENLLGYFYDDKEYVLDLILNKRLNDNVIWAIITSTEDSIMIDVLLSLPEDILNKILNGSGYAKESPEYYNYSSEYKAKVLIPDMVNFNRSLNPQIREHFNVKLD